MTPQQTSLQAYYQEVLPNIGKNQEKVLKTLIILGKASNMMIAEALGWSINRVTPRVNELRKIGKIREFNTALCYVTHRNVKYWESFP